MVCAGACYDVMRGRSAGKWLPYSLNGSEYECKTTQTQTQTQTQDTNTSTSTGIKKVETRQLSLEEIDARLKRDRNELKTYLEILFRIRFTQEKIKDCNWHRFFPHMTPVFDYLFRKSSPSLIKYYCYNILGISSSRLV